MGSKQDKVLFLMTPDRRHLVVELDQKYNQRELEILLTAFRKRLLRDDSETGSKAKSTSRLPRRAAAVNRIVGSGFVIEVLGRDGCVNEK